MEHNYKRESLALKQIIGGDSSSSSVDEFFAEVWQKACVIFSNSSSSTQNSQEPTLPFDQDRGQSSPYEELIRNGWSSLTNLLENSRLRLDGTSQHAGSSDFCPLLFQNQQPVDPHSKYSSSSLYHAYLDGCSVVINHADETCPYIATLCEDLQQSFPHAYANTYLTPPNSQAVPPHADDRDVLIIQVVGQKHWRVYRKIPIPFPYPHEQVGKEGMEIPPPVLEGPLLIDRVLRPGDVLYMPRGYVHEARSLEEEPSFHVTVALATHDWTLSGILTTATQHTLGRIIDYRMALPLHYGREQCSGSDKAELQQQIDHCFEELKKQITADSVMNNLGYKYQRHNERVSPIRRECILKAKEEATTTTNCTEVVGRSAALRVTLSTVLRAATSEEKASVLQTTTQPAARGLHTREDIADSILSCLFKLKGETGLRCSVRDLRTLMDGKKNPLICDLALLSFAKCCVELGALATIMT